MVLMMQGPSLVKTNLTQFFFNGEKIETTEEELERKILESNLNKLTKNCSKTVSKTDNSKIMVCDAMKQKVKDVLIQKCGVALVKLEQPNNDQFEVGLNHVKIVIHLLKRLGIVDQRLIEVSDSILKKSVTFLSKTLEENKNLTANNRSLMTTLEHWSSFLNSLSGRKLKIF